MLLLGVGYDKATVLHLAEYRLTTASRRYHSKVLSAESRGGEWLEYQGLCLDDSDFAALGAAMQRDSVWVGVGRVGAGPAICFPMRPAVDYAEKWMGDHRAATASA